MNDRSAPPKSQRFATFLAAAFIGLAAGFSLLHVIVAFAQGLTFFERLLAAGLLASEIFFGICGIGYASWIIKARGYASADHRYFTASSDSSIACLIPVADEPIEVVEATVSAVCGLRYLNKRVYLLDDCAKSENSAAVRHLAGLYKAEWVKRPERRHYKAGNINHVLEMLDEDYIAVFDADQRPSATFLSDLAPLLDDDPKLAVVQTPQAYDNTGQPIAAAASWQNGLFYEYVAEAKDVAGAMFCCGTNFIMRRQALKDIGGFDTSSLTEDFATSLKLHAAGWRTRFYESLYVVGMGPETLASYLKQYSRWATGTLQVLKMVIKLFIKDRKALSRRQWLEYALSSCYYLSGPINFFLLLLPAAYIFFGVQLIRLDPIIYFSLLLANTAVFWMLFLSTSSRRGYPAKDLLFTCARLETCKFHVYMEALINTITGKPLRFEVTEKGAGRRLPWNSLWVPLAVLALNMISVTAGLAFLSQGFVWPTLANTLFSAYNVWMLSAVIELNDDGLPAYASSGAPA